MIPAGFEPVLRELAPVRDRFAAAGHRLYLVGGTVRDLLVGDGRTDFDLDATTPARPSEVKAVLTGWADAVWTQGERFGTIGAMKRVVDPQTGEELERIYEITTHRAESYDGLTRKPTVEFADDIVADLSRRDFTVNAMAIELTADVPTLVDPFHGADDLVAQVLRTPLEPHVSFSDDPLRMLRAARFIARYRLVPTPELVAAVGEMAGRLTIVSAERIQAEMAKLLAAPDPTAGLDFLLHSGIGRYVVPELEALDAASRADTLRLVAAVPAGRLAVRTAALLQPGGSAAAVGRLRAWKSSNADVDAVDAILVGFERWQPLLDLAGDWTDSEVRRFLRDTRPFLDDLVLLARVSADVHAQRGRTARIESFEAHMAALAERESLDDLGPELDGETVKRVLGLSPGREVGEALAHLQQLRLDEGPLGRAEATERLRRWWAQRG